MHFSLGSRRTHSRRRGGRWRRRLRRCRSAGTRRRQGRARRCRTGPPPSPPSAPPSPCSSPAGDNVPPIKQRAIHNTMHIFLRESSIDGVRTWRQRPQDGWPCAPAGPQNAVQPYLCRHTSGMSASHVAQKMLATRRSQLIFSGLYRLYVAATLLACCAAAPLADKQTTTNATRTSTDTGILAPAAATSVAMPLSS